METSHSSVLYVCACLHTCVNMCMPMHLFVCFLCLHRNVFSYVTEHIHVYMLEVDCLVRKSVERCKHKGALQLPCMTLTTIFYLFAFNTFVQHCMHIQSVKKMIPVNVLFLCSKMPFILIILTNVQAMSKLLPLI